MLPIHNCASFRFDVLDRRISEAMWRVGVPTLRTALAIVFVWFGALKLTGTSPAMDLVTRTVYWLPPELFIPILGWWEIAIGACLAVPKLTRVGILLLALQMPGTFLPLVLLPDVCYQGSFWNLTLEGQYIVKNLVIIGSALLLGGLVRREKMAAPRGDPPPRQERSRM